MMQSVRSVTTKVAAVIFGFLMLLFVVQLSGIFDGGNTLFTRTSVGKINGQAVNLRNYEAAVQQTIDQRQRSTPGRLGLEEAARIRDEVWDQFVQQSVLEGQYAKHGISVSNDEVISAIRNEPLREIQASPEFQTDGRFDLAKYQRWLGSPSAAPVVEGLAAQYREDIRRSKLYSQVTADVYLSDASLWQYYRDQQEQVTVQLTAIVPRRAVPDSGIAVTPAEVSEYYRTHMDEFKRPRTAFLSYVTLSRATNAADTAAALERARAVRTEIQGGAPFAEVAQRESADSSNAAKGGDLGEWKKGTMDPAFDMAAFALPVNAVSEPVLSSFGYHIIQVTSRTGDKATGRHILIPVELAGAHRDEVDARADSLDRLSAEATEGTALDDIAKRLGAAVRAAEPVQEGGRVLVGNAMIPDAGVWAFQNKPGAISDVIETPFALYAFRLDSLHEAGTPKLETVRGAVEQAVRDQKKIGQAREVAKRYVARLDNGESMVDAAKAMDLPSSQFGPFPRVNPPLTNPVVVGAAFGLKQGERSGILETDEGLYVIQVVSRVAADSAKFAQELDQVRSRSVIAAKQDRVRLYIQGLRDKAKIEDNRAAILQQGRQQAQQLPQPVL
jgi:peptidyl-prolyl cis-trans isomerase D